MLVANLWEQGLELSLTINIFFLNVLIHSQRTLFYGPNVQTIPVSDFLASVNEMNPKIEKILLKQQENPHLLCSDIIQLHSLKIVGPSVRTYKHYELPCLNYLLHVNLNLTHYPQPSLGCEQCMFTQKISKPFLYQTKSFYFPLPAFIYRLDFNSFFEALISLLYQSTGDYCLLSCFIFSLTCCSLSASPDLY